jgi:hypothetical protein
MGMIILNQLRWKELFETIGLAAIVASLVFVGYQVRQDRAIARAQLGSESIFLLNATYEVMYDPGFSEAYAKMLDNPGGLSTSEMLQINYRLESITGIFFRECYLVRRGVFVGCESLIRTHIPLFFGNKYAQMWWEGSTFKPLLPGWVDEEISKLDPNTEMRKIEAIKNN